MRKLRTALVTTIILTSIGTLISGCGGEISRLSKKASNQENGGGGGHGGGGGSVVPPIVNVEISNLPAQLDRVGVSSFLTSRFGDPADAIAQKLIRSDASDFGGRCDPKSETNPAYPCEGADAYGPSHARLGLSRFALTQRACDAVLGGPSGDDSVKRAAAMALGSNTPAVVPPKLDDTSLTKVWSLFNADHTLTAAVKTSLNTLITNSRSQTKALNYTDEQSRLDEWRFVMLALCASPDWQFLN